MFLKSMFQKSMSATETPEQEHESTTIYDCQKVEIHSGVDDKQIPFTLFVIDGDTQKERKLRIDKDCEAFYSVYIMNDDGKTIQKPI